MDPSHVTPLRKWMRWPFHRVPSYLVQQRLGSPSWSPGIPWLSSFPSCRYPGQYSVFPYHTKCFSGYLLLKFYARLKGPLLLCFVSFIIWSRFLSTTIYPHFCWLARLYDTMQVFPFTILKFMKLHHYKLCQSTHFQSIRISIWIHYN